MKIIIKKEKNIDFSIIVALKALYMEGSEINSIEDISRFKQIYNEYGIIEIEVNDKAIELFEGYFLNEELIFQIKGED